jgi:hypothetical protein
MRWTWLAVVSLVAWSVAGCKVDELLERDIMIEDVIARREGAKVHVRVVIRNMGESRKDVTDSKKKGCVRATWRSEGKILAAADGCGERTLYPDYTDEIALSAEDIPSPPVRVELHVALTQGGCDDCLTDPGDTDWTGLSP